MFDKHKDAPKNGNGNGGAKPQDVKPGAGALDKAAPGPTMKAARTLIGSRVAVSAEERSKLCGMLQRTLATSQDLQSQIKQAHWNVIGPHFIAYHELFDKIYAHAVEWTDLMAERSATLGGVPQGTVRQAAALSALEDYTLGAAEGPSHVELLSERFQTFCQLVRDSVDAMERDALHDPATQDLLTQVLREAELDLWFLDKHTQRA
jgi:starvation-inducible DNA-binding protein